MNAEYSWYASKAQSLGTSILTKLKWGIPTYAKAYLSSFVTCFISATYLKNYNLLIMFFVTIAINRWRLTKSNHSTLIIIDCNYNRFIMKFYALITNAGKNNWEKTLFTLKDIMRGYL